MVNIILEIIYGAKPAYDGADYAFLEQSFGAVSAIAIFWLCASSVGNKHSYLREVNSSNSC